MHTARISNLSADESGRFLVTASDDKTLRVWEIATGRLLRVLRPPIGQGHEGKMYATAIAPDGNTVAGAGWSGLEWDGTYSIYLFDRASGHMLRRITGLPQSILHLAFSPDGRILLATFHGKQGIRFYRATDGKLLAEDPSYGAETYGAAYDKSGRVATASYDGIVRLYSTDFRLLAQTKIPEGKRPFSIALTADGSKVAVGYENSAHIDVFSGENLRYLYSPDVRDIRDEYLNAVAWSADGDTLYAGGQYRHNHTHLIRKWTRQGEGQWKDLPASSNTILRLISLRTGGIAFGAADPAVGIIDSRDTMIFFKESDIPDYRDHSDRFLLSADGTTIQFSYNKKSQRTARFSIGERLLQENPPLLPALLPPRMPGPDLAVNDWKNSHAPTLNGRRIPLMPYEISRCLAISPDEHTALLGTTWHLRLFDGHGRELWRVAVPANVWSVNIASTGMVAAAALGDGTIRWYRMSDGKELLALFPHPDAKRWVAWTPSGYYDAAPGAETLLGWHKNYGSDTAADFFPAARFRSISYRPAIVKAVLETFDEQQAAAYSLSVAPQATEKQPLVILSPHDGAPVTSTTVRIRYKVHPMGTASDAIVVMVDDKVVPASRGVMVTSSTTASDIREVDVQIPERDCKISLAFADQSGGSTPVSVRVKWTPSFAVKPMLYVLAVGVDNTPHEKATGSIAARDARDVAAALQLQAGAAYRGVVTKVFTDKDATNDAILDGLDWLDRETTGKDVAAFFLKGLVVPDRNGNPYFLTAQADPHRLRSTALPLSDIKNVIGGLAGRSILFLDVCQANDLHSTNTCAAAIENFANDLSGSERGVVVFSPTTAQPSGYDQPAKGNGAFAIALIEGIKGKAAYGETGYITVGMLDLYMSQRIKTLTNASRILMTTKSYDLPDFVVASTKGNSHEPMPSTIVDEQPNQPASQSSEILRRLPPVISIVSPPDGETVSTNRLTVRYSIRTPSKEPVTDLIGLVDGRPFTVLSSGASHRVERTEDGAEVRAVQLDIPERDSEISLLAKNRWASSEPATIRIRWNRQASSQLAPSPKPSLYALAIGISRYDDRKLSLEFAAKDASDFAAALKRQQGGLYKTVVTKVLTDAQATKHNILEALEWLERETTQNDVAVMFLAGHGVNDKNGIYYFLPVNGTVDQLRRTGLAFSDIRNAIASLAGKTLLFADTCHSGNIFGKRRGALDINALVNELTSAENGAVVFASSTGKQDSLEDPKWGNGAFTKALVEALNGKAAYGGGKKITINMLDLYLSERVKELTKGQQTPTTTKPPTIQDFPIALQMDPA